MNSNNSTDVALIHKVCGQLPVFYNTVAFLITAKAIRQRISELGSDNFLQMLEVSLVNSMIHEWYVLFDVKGGNNYWKQLTVEHKAYRDRIYEITGFNYSEWTRFRDHVGSLRNDGLSNNSGSNAAMELSDDDLEKLLAIYRFTYSWLYDHAAGVDNEADDLFRPLDFIDTLISDVAARVEQLSVQ